MMFKGSMFKNTSIIDGLSVEIVANEDVKAVAASYRVSKPQTVNYPVLDPDPVEGYYIYDDGELVPASKDPYPGVPIFGK